MEVEAAAMETIIDAATRLKGDIKGEDDLQIQGVVEGSVQTTAKVVVAQGGLVQGPISGHEVQVFGTVEGDVHVRGQFLLGPSGKVQGDVRASHIKVEDGGILQGKVLMEGAAGFQSHERK
jgi:cytoskeletal protein CcmA (bactofilin family)